MAVAKINTKIGTEGVKEYKQATKDITHGLKLMGAEMKQLSAEFKGNEQSVEALTAKKTNLEKQLEAQEKRAELTKKAICPTGYNHGNQKGQCL